MKSTQLAWRNIRRNRRRSSITMASVLFAVFFCSIMSSYTEGMWNRMIENTLRTRSGHIEIHGKGYWDDKITDNFMTADHAVIERLRMTDNVENVSPRVETFALASFGNVSKGIGIVAVSPEQENAKSKLATRLTKGDYFTENDNGVLIGEGLAGYLHAGIGDTLAFIGQGHFGASAAGLFPIRGIFHSAIAEINSGLVYMTLPAAQQFIDMPDGYSGILISLKDASRLNETMKTVAGLLQTAPYNLRNENEIEAGDYEIFPWHFTMQRLLQSARSDKAFNEIVLFILYMIVGFGILGTVIMLTNERKKEFRTMISLGMNRGRLSRTVALELLMMTLSGMAAGFALSLPVAYRFHTHPIHIGGELAKMFLDMGMEPVIPFSIDAGIFVTQAVIVFILTVMATIYPVRKIRKLVLMER
jgi:ABC-type lipoprotein release transport system permease subunit